jgi:Caspase recruitment domain
MYHIVNDNAHSRVSQPCNSSYFTAESTSFLTWLVADKVNTNLRPLPDKQRLQLKTNLPNLLEIMKADSLIADLFAEGCINKMQKDYLKAQATQTDKNGELVDIMMRRSYADFKTFLQILHMTNQDHVAKVFEEDGGKFTCNQHRYILLS